MKKWLPLIITLLVAGWYAGKLRVPADKDWAFNDFGRIPVVVDGRHMPMDTLARTVLTLLRERQSANYEPWKGGLEKPRLASATEWALEAMVSPAIADTRPVIRIDNPDLKGLFDLPQQADKAKQTDGKHFSWEQLQPKWPEFISEVRRASAKDGDKQTPYEQALVRLAGGAQAYRKMKLTFGPAASGDLAAGLTKYQQRIAAWRDAFKASLQGQEFDQEAYGWGEEQRASAALIAPRKGAEKAGDSKWASPFDEALAIERGESAPSLAGYAAIAKAFRSGDREGFATAVRSHLDSIKAKEGFAADLNKASREQLLSFAAPFYWGMWIAVIAGLMAVISWFSTARLEWLRRTAVQLMLLVLVMHTAGLIARYLIEGRPPVTTLYTSAIFIGWAAAIFGLLFEKIYPYAIGVVVAAALEFGALFIAHNLHINDGTTFKVLQPVLDTNFWLATHVVMVTLGYAATFVAGFIAIIYIIRAATGNLASDLAKSLTRMTYAIVCFATLFSFVGTVLGGLWADQSWGRFWGWDVKENGALMIVIWNAILLHARWGGIVRERGLMCLAIFGNVVTAWSWFGVNNLGIGLHSYGFTTGVMIALGAFVALQLALIICAWTLCEPVVKDEKSKPEPEPQPA
jgi:ABC-type transport system involved in cytochrome c biogenesis permease subunit